MANSGDCQAVLVSSTDNHAKGENLCEIHSSNLDSEQRKLKKEHPGEKDIVVCKKPTACYVKGRLMPTRSFGDLHLKSEEFNNPRGLTALHGFRKSQIQPFTGPYITHSPDIQIKPIHQTDRFLILASDGLWDEMNEQEASEIAYEATDPQQAADLLIASALQRAALRRRMNLQELMSLEPTRRRSYHDDISVIVVPLH